MQGQQGLKNGFPEEKSAKPVLACFKNHSMREEGGPEEAGHRQGTSLGSYLSFRTDFWQF